jgi:hypothetical protein
MSPEGCITSRTHPSLTAATLSHYGKVNGVPHSPSKKKKGNLCHILEIFPSEMLHENNL